VFVNTGRDLLAAAACVVEKGRGRAGFIKPPAATP